MVVDSEAFYSIMEMACFVRTFAAQIVDFIVIHVLVVEKFGHVL